MKLNVKLNCSVGDLLRNYVRCIRYDFLKNPINSFLNKFQAFKHLLFRILILSDSKTTRQGVELDDPGDIHGVPTIEFSLTTLGEEDKPWKRPGADITDYFNYGFTEETWIQYCEKQKILRQEYANATLKPVLGSGGTGLLQRMRTGGANTGIRSYDNFKSASINVINLSNATMVNRGSAPGLLGPKESSDAQSTILNGGNNNTASLLGQFTQPPPGYLSSGAQLDGSSGAAGATGTGVFTVPPPSFSALTAGGTQILTNPSATGTGSSSNVFPNLNMPPPVLGSLAGNWPGSLGVHNLLNPGDALIDPATGQLTGLLDHSRRSPESV
ncbi:Pre-mRNA 3'-end-processing factor FIP1 [Fasciolopsis buskii]|uniref:Pre-mRNA 3'-end-processing factor FIP1 n=1 Tax=Fasciolopsis buskii TaxID=27845 RepID=A0A8E0VPU3_9TREM|nr:Pre-mRNA 3'-end-processing factor FIP1 [Fasciolopsis buski]